MYNVDVVEAVVSLSLDRLPLKRDVPFRGSRS